MLKRLLLIVFIVAALSGCAKPPVAELEDARSVVDHAYASGAARHAPGEYQLASSALMAAEQQVRDGDFRKALRTLALARRYSSEALNITLERKKQLALEQQRLAEQQRLEQLQKEQELEKIRQEQEKRLQEQQKQAARLAAQKAAEKEVVVKKTPPAPPEPVLLDRVEVRPGENLATLAARPDVYKDALLWPLIYKANRDQIKNPQEIFAGQIFVIPRDKSRDDADAARQEARELNLF